MGSTTWIVSTIHEPYLHEPQPLIVADILVFETKTKIVPLDSSDRPRKVTLDSPEHSLESAEDAQQHTGYASSNAAVFLPHTLSNNKGRVT